MIYQRNPVANKPILAKLQELKTMSHITILYYVQWKLIYHSSRKAEKEVCREDP